MQIKLKDILKYQVSAYVLDNKTILSQHVTNHTKTCVLTIATVGSMSLSMNTILTINKQDQFLLGKSNQVIRFQAYGQEITPTVYSMLELNDGNLIINIKRPIH